MSKFISIIQVRGCERIPFQISPRKARKLVENGILIEVTYSGCLISNPRIITTHQHTNSTDRISTFVSNVSILCRSLSRYIRSKTLTKHIDERFMLCATHPLPILLSSGAESYQNCRSTDDVQHLALWMHRNIGSV